MKRGEHPVKVRELDQATGQKVSKQVGIANFPIYDSVAEAIDDVGEDKVLELVNAQTRTNELNRVRGLSRPGGVSKTALRNKAITMVTPEEWAQVAGNPQAIEALLEAKMEIAKAEILAAGGGDDEDND